MELKPAHLRRVLTERLSLDDLRTLSFDLEVDFDNLSGESKEIKVINLITYFIQRHNVSELVKQVKNQRPDIEDLDVFIENAPSSSSIRRVCKELQQYTSDLLKDSQEILTPILSGLPDKKAIATETFFYYSQQQNELVEYYGWVASIDAFIEQAIEGSIRSHLEELKRSLIALSKLLFGINNPEASLAIALRWAVDSNELINNYLSQLREAASKIGYATQRVLDDAHV